MSKKEKKKSIVDLGYVPKNDGNESRKGFRPTKGTENPAPLSLADLFEFDFSWFVEIHEHEMQHKFKPGQMVKYTGDALPELKGCIYKVLAGNRQDSETVEYCLENFPYLVYEEEIRLASEESKDVL